MLDENGNNLYNEKRYFPQVGHFFKVVIRTETECFCKYKLFDYLRYLIVDKEVYEIWKWHFSRKKGRDLKCMASEREWVLRVEERFWQPDGEKEEKDYLHKIFTWAAKNLWPVFYTRECAVNLLSGSMQPAWKKKKIFLFDCRGRCRWNFRHH